MMRSNLFEVTFRVQVTTKPGEVVCVVGDSKQLGDWNPNKARKLVRDRNTNDKEVWEGTFKLPGDREARYRYFVCQPIDAEHEEEDCDIIITRWETNRHPRRFIPSTLCVKQEDCDVGDAEFGHYDGRTSEDKGWLTGQTEIQIRLHSNPIHMWKQRHQLQTYRVKCTPYDLRHRDMARDTDCEVPNPIDDFDDDTIQDLPVTRGLKTVEVAILADDDRARGHDQGPYGEVYDNDSYVIFKTQAFEPEFLGFTLDFYVLRNGTSSHSTDAPKHVGYSYLLPVNFKETAGLKTVPISGLKHRPIGQITIEYLIVKPLLGITQNMQVSFARHWKKHRRALDVGHRGMGVSYKAKTLAAVRENTIASLAAAGSHGADMVEFDVQLSKDLQPVIYHDFSVCLTLKKKGNPKDLELFKVPVKDLTLAQLQKLKLSHSTATSADDGENVDPAEHSPFPTLRQAFESIDPHVGFNIEIKYAMLKRNGRYEDDQEHYTERNMYLDIILREILQYSGNRRIILSCFDPDVCIMLRRKQNKYPVLFLTLALSPKYDGFDDKRTQHVGKAMQFGLSEALLGINVHTEELFLNKDYIQMCKEKGLVLFCWGEDNNDTANIRQLKELGVEGVIYDRIYDLKDNKENIFKMEHECKIKLLQEIGILGKTDHTDVKLSNSSDGSRKTSVTSSRKGSLP